MDFKYLFNFFKFFTLIFLSLFIVNCTVKVVEVSNPNKMPDWIYNPSYKGKIGGVGYSRTHIKGINAQKDLATRRALEDIARQKGVKVYSEMEIHSNSKSSGVSGSSASNIVTFTNQTGTSTIKATIREVWINPTTKEMYVHMVED